MLDSVKKDWISLVVISWFVILSLWWLILFTTGNADLNQNYSFGLVYGTSMTLFGAAVGLTNSRIWGGYSSLMGKAMIFLSLGLLAQFLGQLVFSIYNIFLAVEVPYPSLADVGYFGSIPLYIIGIVVLGKSAGVKISQTSWKNLALSVILPGCMLIATYLLFLNHYESDPATPLKTLLDFGYPLGQATYVSLAILAYTLSKGVLGGIMKHRITLVICAFIAQYVADFNFLYQSTHGTWINAGYGDYLYLIAYFLMALGLIQLRHVANNIRSN